MVNRICEDCGQVYSPCIREGGRMPKGYKICPSCESENTKPTDRQL